MRDHPWHLKLPATEHFQWFKNLVDLHEITSSWLKEVHTAQPSYALTRGISPEVTQSLWMLNTLSKTKLENLLEESSPEDLLLRLEKTIWIVQGWTIDKLYSYSETAQDHLILDRLLEQTCWNLGRNCAQTRWHHLLMLQSQSQSHFTFRDIFLALYDSPMAGYPRKEGFLVKRATEKEILIELRSCPHQQEIPEIQSSADKMCQFHLAWMRGFAYAFDTQVHLEMNQTKPRCTQRWSIS